MSANPVSFFSINGRYMLVVALFAAFLSLLYAWFWPFSSGLKEDEELIFFPTSAAKNIDGSWALPVHTWVFERQENDILPRLGRALIAELLEQFGVSDQETNSQLFKERIQYFLVDNERGKKIKISLSSLKRSAPLEVQLDKTSANGQARTLVKYSRSESDGSWLTLAAKLPKSDQRNFLGQIKLVPPTGHSVICDIDDTIKVSNVLDKRELIRNSLFRPYQPVLAMSRHLRELEKGGAYFHYVSASPWQLYPSLRQFFDNYVPRGTVALRDFRLKESSFMAFLRSSKAYKTDRIHAILKRYPKHYFTLIGDSGEHDPEVYGSIYRSFPSQIKTITIRTVAGSDMREQRFMEAFKDVPDKVWSLRSFAVQ